jgi:FkbM family methyltransferase
LAFFAKIFNLIKIIFGYLSSKLVLLIGGNFFYKDFNTDLKLIKNLKYKKLCMRVKINNFWDYWRISNYENYPVDCILNDTMSRENQTKKIIFYEIGANIGYSSILISKILSNRGKVYSFEVEPTNYKTLCDNIILNRLENIVPINIGISSDNSISKFYYNTLFNKDRDYLPQSAMGGHSITFDKNMHKKNVYCFVPLMNFEKVISTFNLVKPTHIYIDAYGAEIEIIKSIMSTSASSELTKIMVDIEEKVESIEQSKVFQILNNMNFQLISNKKEIGGGSIPDSYKTIFERKI